MAAQSPNSTAYFMTTLQEQARAWLPLIQAAAEGKQLQRRDVNGAWHDDDADFAPASVFRIKPTPREFWIAKNSLFVTHALASSFCVNPDEVIHVREVL